MMNNPGGSYFPHPQHNVPQRANPPWSQLPSGPVQRGHCPQGANPPWSQLPAGPVQRGHCPQGPAYPHCPGNRMMSRAPSEDIFGYNLNPRPSGIGQFRPPFPPFNPRHRSPHNEGPRHNNPNYHGPRHNNPNGHSQQQGGIHGNQGHDEWRNGRNNCQARGNGHRKKRGQKKNKKVNKSDLAENNKFYCDVCDRGYKDEDKYQDHVNQHVKCKYESCAYVAHPKLVQLHINLQHRSGLAKKIWQLESKEDVEKWRNERKKNFPTAENIARKEEEKARRIARGEVIETKSFGKFKNSAGKGVKENCTGQRKRDWKERKRQKWLAKNGSEARDTESLERHGGGSPAKRTKPDTTIETKKSAISTPCFDPLSMLETRETSPQADKSSEATIRGALGNLISSYADSEEEEEEQREEQREEDVGGGAEAVIAEDVEDCTPRRKRHRKRKKGNNQKRENNNRITTITKSTLLEKLLAPAIRHERNVIMQCVHYIVSNNFFDKEPCEHSLADSVG